MAQDQKHAGRTTILAAIRKAGRIARVDLAQQTGISPPTVTALTAELISFGLIQEVAANQPSAGRGRPRVDLAVRGAALRVAGVKLTHRSASMVILDFAGHEVADFTTILPHSTAPTSVVVSAIASAVRAGADQAGVGIDALGLGIQGVVDATRGFVYWSPSLDERNTPLGAMLAEALSLPVFVDNDANLVAMAEKHFGYGRGVSDFIVATIENGVGMGIVLGDEVYRGTRGCGAEFGHTKVELDGALCRCGQRGCLEAYVADYALLREAVVATGLTGTGDANQLDALFAAAKNGDAIAQSIFLRAGRIFAMGLANIVNIFDPQLIILSGERMQYDYLYADEVIASIRNSIVQIDLPPPEVRIHKWGDQMWAKGAAAFAIEGAAKIALENMTSRTR